jgi:hypothetical protein
MLSSAGFVWATKEIPVLAGLDIVGFLDGRVFNCGAKIK